MASNTTDFTIDCPIPPETVFTALTDFSPRRLKYYPNLSRSTYRVLDSSDLSARVEEGTGPFRSQVRYDWSTPGRIWSVIERSNVFAPGGMTDIRIDRRKDGGSHIQVHLEREFVGRRGQLLLASAILNGRKGFFQRPFRKTLRNIAQEAKKS